MTVAALDTNNVGVAIGALILPLLGLILFIVGLVQRTRSNRQPPAMLPGYPGYPGQTPPTGQYGPPYPAPPHSPWPQTPTGYPPFPPTPIGAGARYPATPGYWPPPRPKPAGTGLIVAGAVILGLSLLGGVVRAGGSSDSATGLMVGQCVAEDEFERGASESTDCRNPSAVMELASRGGANADCPDGKDRDDTDYTTLVWDNATMCFAANLVEGDCYAVRVDNSSDSPFKHEDCDDSRAGVKVVQRVDGTTDAALCPLDTKPTSYPQPARLYCIEAAR